MLIPRYPTPLPYRKKVRSAFCGTLSFIFQRCRWRTHEAPGTEPPGPPCNLPTPPHFARLRRGGTWRREKARMATLTNDWPGALAALRMPTTLDVLTFERYGAWRIRGYGQAATYVADGYDPGFDQEVSYDSSYDPSYRPGSYVDIPLLGGLEKYHIEFSVSSESVFYNPLIFRFPSGDFSHDGYWQTPGTVGVGGDPLKGAIEVSWDGAEPRIRYRRDKGAWIVSDLTQMRSSWVWEYFAPHDGQWRYLGFFSKPLNDPATQYPTKAAYAGVSDTPPGPPYTTNGWTVDNVYVFAAEPAPKPTPATSFWTNLINCREVGTGAGSGGGVAPGPTDTPGAGGGDSLETATTVNSLPYSAVVGGVSSGASKWFSVTLPAGTYRFHTTDSPDPLIYDTFIVVGASLDAPPNGMNDDVSGSDLRSDLTLTLGAGTYFVAVTGAEGAAVPAGAILKIEAV